MYDVSLRVEEVLSLEMIEACIRGHLNHVRDSTI